MNLRILKKLSKKAAPLIAALQDKRGRGFQHFVGDRGDPGYAATCGHDLKHWDRSPAVHADLLWETSIVVQPRSRAGTRYPFIHLREPGLVWPGTPMVGWMSGYEEPEWEEQDAWAYLREIVYAATTDFRFVDDDMEAVQLEKIRNPADVLSKARSMAAQQGGRVDG